MGLCCFRKVETGERQTKNQEQPSSTAARFCLVGFTRASVISLALPCSRIQSGCHRGPTEGSQQIFPLGFLFTGQQQYWGTHLERQIKSKTSLPHGERPGRQPLHTLIQWLRQVSGNLGSGSRPGNEARPVVWYTCMGHTH